MKRSEINKAIMLAKDVLEKYRITLPSFGYMSRNDWEKAGPEYRQIIKNKLGWDISDFGSDDFDNFGTVQFTLRNGDIYAEKYIILKPGQRLPLHFHFSKTEDIINRGGGILVLELYNAHKNDEVDKKSDVTVFCDGIKRIVKAGEHFEIKPGDSITLTPRMYHRFWASKDSGILICGEVSAVNDDIKDNYFAEPVRRFAKIEEDENPIHLLCNEYKI